jgi:hypothetical protein
LSFTLTEKCVNKRVAAPFIIRRISNFRSIFLWEKNILHDHWIRIQSVVWWRGRPALGIYARRPTTFSSVSRK